MVTLHLHFSNKFSITNSSSGLCFSNGHNLSHCIDSENARDGTQDLMSKDEGSACTNTYSLKDVEQCLVKRHLNNQPVRVNTSYKQCAEETRVNRERNIPDMSIRHAGNAPAAVGSLATFTRTERERGSLLGVHMAINAPWHT